MFAVGDDWFLERFLLWIPLLLSLTVHEWAHAASASLLGDDTALRLGRLTLNPLAHIDPIGTLILPLLGVPFGWAKPVPVNPLRFRREVGMTNGLLLVAAAGPASNLILALAAAGVLAVVLRTGGAGAGSGTLDLLQMAIVLNVLLAAFNLLPIPPLDGSRVADALMPRSLRPLWESFTRVGGVLLLVVLALPLAGGFNLLRWPQEWALRLIEIIKP